MKTLLVVPRKAQIVLPARRCLVLPTLFACLLLLAGPAAHAQSATAGITSIDDTTSTPVEGAGHDYIKGLSETVNPANGSVSMRIQLPIPKGRGITPDFSVAYDSDSGMTSMTQSKVNEA